MMPAAASESAVSPTDRGPRLSLCIATLNRAAFIPETLDSITRQLTDEVELVVLDGASSDGTEAIMLAQEAACPNLRYIRQPNNYGLDRDYSTAVERCRGEYVWLMTDDDLLVNGAIDEVLALLNGLPSLVVVNAEVRNADMSRLLQARRLDTSVDRTFRSDESDLLLAFAGSYLSFIGCVIIRRELWLARDKEPYFGTLFIHVGVIFQKPFPAHTVVVGRPLVSIRYGNAMWRPKEFEIWMFKWPLLIWSFAHISSHAKTAVTAAEPWRDPKLLLFYRAKGSYTPDAYRRWIRERMGTSLRRTVARAIAYAPGMLINGAALIYVRLAGRGVYTGLMDLRASRFYFRNWFSAKS